MSQAPGWWTGCCVPCRRMTSYDMPVSPRLLGLHRSGSFHLITTFNRDQRCFPYSSIIQIHTLPRPNERPFIDVWPWGLTVSPRPELVGLPNSQAMSSPARCLLLTIDNIPYNGGISFSQLSRGPIDATTCPALSGRSCLKHLLQLYIYRACFLERIKATIANLVSSLSLQGPSHRTTQAPSAKMPIDDNHPFVPPSSGDSRSPCPAMNSLANHGYLPHDGRNITKAQLRSALMGVFNVSHGVATVFALLALVLWGHKKPGFTLCRVVDLHELARHNVVEHDGSLVHDDAPTPKDKYAPTAVNHAFVKQLVDAAPAGHDSLTLEDLCRAHVRRLMPAASRPINKLQMLFGKAEMALVSHAVGVSAAHVRSLSSDEHSREELETKITPVPHAIDDQAIAEEDRKENTGARRDAMDGNSGEKWLGEERLPDGWERPSIQLNRVVLHTRVQGGSWRMRSGVRAGK
ncbi:hypothetical protein C8Q74DRAFT_274197 [Fomes fomentarius]|nr:hypothetical protein C8Q74DRAFT_274197 [Fomes fomentarius]